MQQQQQWRFKKTSDSEIETFSAHKFMDALQCVSNKWFKRAVVKDWRQTAPGHYKLLRQSKTAKEIGVVIYVGDQE